MPLWGSPKMCHYGGCSLETFCVMNCFGSKVRSSVFSPAVNFPTFSPERAIRVNLAQMFVLPLLPCLSRPFLAYMHIVGHAPSCGVWGRVMAWKRFRCGRVCSRWSYLCQSTTLCFPSAQLHGFCTKSTVRLGLCHGGCWVACIGALCKLWQRGLRVGQMPGTITIFFQFLIF